MLKSTTSTMEIGYKGRRRCPNFQKILLILGELFSGGLSKSTNSKEPRVEDLNFLFIVISIEIMCYNCFFNVTQDIYAMVFPSHNNKQGFLTQPVNNILNSLVEGYILIYLFLIPILLNFCSLKHVQLFLTAQASSGICCGLCQTEEVRIKIRFTLFWLFVFLLFAI